MTTNNGVPIFLPPLAGTLVNPPAWALKGCIIERNIINNSIENGGSDGVVAHLGNSMTTNNGAHVLLPPSARTPVDPSVWALRGCIIEGKRINNSIDE